MAAANNLANMFSENFAKKYPNMPKNIAEAGPKANNCATQNPGALPPGTSAGKGHASSLRAAVWPFPAVVPSQF